MTGFQVNCVLATASELRQYYAKLYKEFIRPIWPTSRVYHHAPINLRGDVESSPWFAMEFAARDRTRGLRGS